MLGVANSDNPYRLPLHRGLWDYGFKYEKARFEPTKFKQKAPFKPRRRPVGA